MIKFCGLFLLGISLAGCAPFVDSRREAGEVQPVGQSIAGRPAVCYNPLWTDIETVEQMANQVCSASGKKAVFEDTHYFSCSLLTPNTAFYQCK